MCQENEPAPRPRRFHRKRKRVQRLWWGRLQELLHIYLAKNQNNLNSSAPYFPAPTSGAVVASKYITQEIKTTEKQVTRLCATDSVKTAAQYPLHSAAPKPFSSHRNVNTLHDQNQTTKPNWFALFKLERAETVFQFKFPFIKSTAKLLCDWNDGIL